MKISYSKGHIYLIALTLLSSVACNKQSKKIACGPCPEYLEILPGITARIVDKTTGADLFFGIGARYKIGQLQVHHLVNGKQDSAFLSSDSVSKHVFIGFYPAHGTDTVTVQIADLPQDNLIFNSSVVGECCPQLKINSVFFDGAEVYTAANGPNVVVLAK